MRLWFEGQCRGCFSWCCRLLFFPLGAACGGVVSTAVRVPVVTCSIARTSVFRVLLPATTAAAAAVFALAAARLAAAGFAATVATGSINSSLGWSGFTPQKREHGADDGRKFHDQRLSPQVA
jgi:hypothetical protein